MGSTHYKGHAFVCCSQDVVEHYYAPSDGHLDKSEEIRDLTTLIVTCSFSRDDIEARFRTAI